MASLSMVMRERGIERDDLGILAENTVWLVTRYDELRAKYPNEYVAVHNKRVLDHDVDMFSLLERLKSKHKKTSYIAIEFVSEEDFELILTIH